MKYRVLTLTYASTPTSSILLLLLQLVVIKLGVPLLLVNADSWCPMARYPWVAEVRFRLWYGAAQVDRENKYLAI